MKRKYMLLLVLVLAVAVVFFYRSNPERHVKTFVSLYGDGIQDSIEAGDGVPENLNCMGIYAWEGEHPMTEFTLSAWGIGSDTRYYGCYYSPDDVPLPFQNGDAALTEKGPGRWVWFGDGDNRGSTQKIRDHWYYFEASF